MRTIVTVWVHDEKGRIKGIRISGSGILASTPGFIENANAALNNAEFYFSRSNFAAAIKEAQVCIEQVIKALMVSLGVTPRMQHDVSDEIKVVIEELKSRGLFETGEIASFQNRLTKVRLLSKTLLEMKPFSTYGDEKLGFPADVLFADNFGRNLCEAILPEVDTVFRCVSEIIEKILNREVK